MPVNMLDSAGNRVVVDDADVPGAIANGFHLESPEEQASRVGAEVQEEQYGGLTGKAAALGAAALRGVTLGGSDVLLSAFSEDARHDLAGLKRINPIASAVGELAGAVVPALVAPTSLLAKTPAGLIGQAAARGYESGRAIGGVRGLATAAAATGVEGAVQGAGAYLSDVALGDRELTAEGMAGALGAGFALGAGAGGALYGIQGGTIAARRMFARQAEGGEQAAKIAEQEWRDQGQRVIEANDQAADAARARLAEMRAAREQADLAQQQARAAYADARAGRVSKPTAAETKLGEVLDEFDAAKADFDAVLAKLEAPAIEPGVVPATRGVPVGEFGAPGTRGYDPVPARAPGPPSPVAAATGDVTSVGKKRIAQGTPVSDPPGMDKFFRDLVRPKTRDAFVAQNIARAMREEGSHAAGLARLEREWSAQAPTQSVVQAPAPVGGDLESQLVAMKQQIDAGADIAQLGAMKRAAPVSPRQLENQYDELIERAAETSDIAAKQQLLRQASEVEEQLAQAGPRSIAHDVADIAPVATRYEQAAAAVAEAAGDAAPQISRDFASAVRKSEDAADAKMMDRAARAVDDAAETPPDALATARARKRAAEADFANARAAETEARIGARAAEQAAKESRAANTASQPAQPTRSRGRRWGIVGDAGAALEVADVLEVPGLPRPRDMPIIGPILSAYLKFRAVRAAAGRFAGRIEATGNTKAAVLSAKTKNRVAVAVDRSLGLAEKVAPKSRALAVAAAARLPRAFDDGEPDVKKDATLPQVVAVRAREVAAAVANPQAVIAQVRRELRDVHDPDLIAAAEKHRLRAFEYLANVAPKAPPPNPYLKREWEPSSAVAMKFAREYEAVFDPASVFEALQERSLTLEAAEALRATSPKLFQMAQERLVSRAGDLDKPVPYDQLLRCSKLFDVPLIPSLEPGAPSILQSTSRAAPRQQPDQQQPPAPSIAGETNLSRLYQTGPDRQSAMR